MERHTFSGQKRALVPVLRRGGSGDLARLAIHGGPEGWFVPLARVCELIPAGSVAMRSGP